MGREVEPPLWDAVGEGKLAGGNTLAVMRQSCSGGNCCDSIHMESRTVSEFIRFVTGGH